MGDILIQTIVHTNPWMLVCVGSMGSFNFLTVSTGSIALSPIADEKTGTQMSPAVRLSSTLVPKLATFAPHHC